MNADLTGWVQATGAGVAIVFVIWLIYRDNRKSGLTELQAALRRNDDDRAEQHKDIEDLKRDVAELKMQIDVQTKWRRTAVRHIRDLREYISRGGPPEQMPPIPHGLDLDD